MKKGFALITKRWWIFVVAFVVVMTYANLPQILKIFYPIPHQELIEKYAAEYEIDPLLVAAMINVESKFSADAVSPQGASGLMQLMPETAKWVASKMDVTYEQNRLFEPQYNLMLGTWYIAELRREFNNNLVSTLAAYNGGRGNVQNWLKEGKWQGNIETISQIPFPETRNYITKVLRRYRIYEYIYRQR